MSALSEQFQLFDPGPAEESNEMWHFSKRNDWDDTRSGNVHVGTQKAALERGFGIDQNQSGRGTLHKFAIQGPMANTPDRPVSDRMANYIFRGDPADGDAGDVFDDEVTVRSDFSDQRSQGIANEWVGTHTQPDSRYARPVEGVYYRNAAEDFGSVSAVVPQADKNLKRTQSFRVTAPTIETEGTHIAPLTEGGNDFATVTDSSAYFYSNPIRVESGRKAHEELAAKTGNPPPYRYTAAASQDRLFPVRASKQTRKPLGSPQFDRYA